MPQILPYLLCSALYAIVAVLLARTVSRPDRAGFAGARALHLGTALPLTLHAILLGRSVFADGQMYLGVGNSISVIVWLTVLVAASAQILVLYYNARMTRFRQEASGIVKYLVGNETDFQGVRHGGKRISWLYDWADLAVWTIILVSSVLLGLAAHSQSI